MPELQVGVKAIVKNKEGKYLVLLRSEKKYPAMGEVWDIVGGRINPGVGLKENLIREIQEEIGLTFTGEPTLLAAQDIFPNTERHVVRLTYSISMDGEPRLNGEEHTAYRWVSFEELKNLPHLDVRFKELLEQGIL